MFQLSFSDHLVRPDPRRLPPLPHHQRQEGGRGPAGRGGAVNVFEKRLSDRSMLFYTRTPQKREKLLDATQKNVSYA